MRQTSRRKRAQRIIKNQTPTLSHSQKSYKNTKQKAIIYTQMTWSNLCWLCRCLLQSLWVHITIAGLIQRTLSPGVLHPLWPKHSFWSSSMGILKLWGGGICIFQHSPLVFLTEVIGDVVCRIPIRQSWHLNWSCGKYMHEIILG